MTSTLAPSFSCTGRPSRASRRERGHLHLDPNRLPHYGDALYRIARALCGSEHDAEDLVQETFANVLKRPRLVHAGNELGYLRRALKNTYASFYRTAQRRPPIRQLCDDDADAAAAGVTDAREILAAIASASGVYRDAVVTVDILGLSYREAATVLDTSEATLTTRLHRGRKHAASQLVNDPTPVR